MKKALSRLLVLLMLLGLTLQVPALAEGEPPQSAAMVEFLLQSGVVSAQYAVMSGGEITASGTAGAFSLFDSDAQLTTKTPYGTGSVSKMFTTAVVMQLCDRGVLALDTPVASYIPEFEMADARYVDITVRHLLNHSSGLPGSTWPGAILWGEASAAAHDAFLDALKTQRLKADPGAFSVYCNDGFTLAEILCERVTGQSFDALIDGLLSLPNTYVPGEGDVFDRAARTYLPTGVETPTEGLNAIGAGGIYSTAEDLVTFAQLFTGESDALSESAQAATMAHEYANGLWPAGLTHNILAFGLGWDSVELFPFDRYGITALCKGGDSLMYHASLIVLPEHNMSAAVLTSGGSSTYNMMVATQLLLEQLLEQGVIEEILPDLPALAGEAAELDLDVAPYAGAYANALMAYNVAFEQDGTLAVSVPAYGEAGTQRFAYVGGGHWIDNDNGVEVWFEETGDTVYLVQNQISTIPGFGQAAAGMYTAQKTPEYTPDEDTLAAWQARNGMSYFMVSEPYNSMTYMSFPATAVMVDEQNPGYMNTHRLAGPDTLASWVQVPVNLGRDWADIQMVSVEGVEFLLMRGYVFMPATQLAPLWSGPRSVCTIQASGYARWYMLAPELAGQTLSFTCPEQAGIVVYDAMGQLVEQSAVSGLHTLILPEGGGYIVFAGQAGDVFSITLETVHVEPPVASPDAQQETVEAMDAGEAAAD